MRAAPLLAGVNREQLAIALLLSAPLGVGIASAVGITDPAKWRLAIATGLVTFVVIFAVVVLAVEYEPPLPEDERGSDLPNSED